VRHDIRLGFVGVVVAWVVCDAMFKFNSWVSRFWGGIACEGQMSGGTVGSGLAGVTATRFPGCAKVRLVEDEFGRT
jgi:hypothetical protein